MVVVLCNLKARKLAGYESHGMVICAETPDRLTAELLTPPSGSVPGDLISFEGFERKPPAVLKIDKKSNKSPWDSVQPKLKIDEHGVATHENIPFKTEKGVVTSKTIKNGIIH